MSPRVLGVLGAAVVALLVGLWVIVGDATPSSPPDPGPVVAKPPEAATQVAPLAPTTRARIGSGAMITRRPTSRPTPEAATGGDPTPALEPAAPPPPPKDEFRRALGDQLMFSEPQLAECIEAATNAGVRIDGETAVGFTFRRKDGKIVVDNTGVEYSSIADKRTTECLRDVSKGMSLEALPDGAEAVTAYRRVVMVEGKITANILTDWVVTPAPPTPAP